MDTPAGTDVRCSTAVFRDEELVLIRRARNGGDAAPGPRLWARAALIGGVS